MIIKIKIILSPAEVSISVQQKFTGFKTVPLLFLDVCKQTLRISKVGISQKAKGVTMHNLGDIFYMKTNV